MCHFMEWTNLLSILRDKETRARQEELREENAARFTKVLDGRLIPHEIVYRNCQNSFSVGTASSLKY